MTVISLGVAQSCIVDLGVKGWTFLHLDLELEVLEQGDRGRKYAIKLLCSTTRTTTVTQRLVTSPKYSSCKQTLYPDRET
jgi:hypothetical protein